MVVHSEFKFTKFEATINVLSVYSAVTRAYWFLHVILVRLCPRTSESVETVFTLVQHQYNTM